MTKRYIFAFIAATLLGAFWVYPGVERSAPRTTSRVPTSAKVPERSDPISHPIQRKKTKIKPIRIKKTISAKSASRHKRAAKVSNRVRAKYEKADRRPTSLPLKKLRPKRDTIASK